MLKAFCDHCGTEAKATISRRFEKIAQSMNAQWLGLEALLLVDGSQTKDSHICDECFTAFLVRTAYRFKHTRIIDKKLTDLNEELVKKEQDLTKLQDSLIAREAAIDQATIELQEKQERYAELVAQGEVSSAEQQQTIDVLRTQLDELTRTTEERIKREVAARYQAKIDHEQMPHYVEAVRAREARRFSK